MKTYTGGCQCGAVKFEMKADDIEEAMSCNCSRCGKAGYLLAFLPKTQLTLLSGEDYLTEYRFGDKTISHLFCKICGIQAFGFGKGHDGAEMAAVNVRCLDDFDLKPLRIKEFDGKSL